MTEHKYTDEEVIRALECCADCDCYNAMAKEDCPFVSIPFCKNYMRKQALDLINRQRAKIEELKEKNLENEKLLDDRVNDSVNAVSKAHLKYEKALEEQLKTTKAEAIKEFAESIKAYYNHIDKTVGALINYTIDQKLKEFLGEGGVGDA